MKKPTTLIIMDGFGLAPAGAGNAIQGAATPVLDRLFAEHPGCKLSASGLDVGLPEGQMGNSEVGHTNIGAGRVVFQDLPRISLAVKDGSFFRNEAYLKAVANCKEHGSALHIFGLLSDGGVHSHIDHIFALLELAQREGLTRVWLHAFLDGRDVPPASGKDYVAAAAAKCAETGAKIATVSGRYYAMDRDKRWERLEKAYRAIVCGEGEFEPDPVTAVQKSYDAGVTDEFVVPVVCARGAELDANMTSIKEETVKVLTPKGGTLQDYAYREGTHVFYRKGIYYFTWSVDDTGSPNYHVAYGTAQSPLGPIQVAQQPIVLAQDPEQEIYGPAHHSVVCKPDSDEWYIVYHRIHPQYVAPSKGPGVHREVCMDRLEFHADGTICRVRPTR